MAQPRLIRMLAPVLFAGLATAAIAQDEEAEDLAAPPPIPPVDAQPAQPVEDEEGDVPIPPKVLDENSRVEPTVEIRRDEDDNIVEEYRMEGRVYMVKVTPKNGVPYYYLDDDGDGQLEIRESDRAAYPVKPIYWKIKEW
jgi:hypothetical protein